MEPVLSRRDALKAAGAAAVLAAGGRLLAGAGPAATRGLDTAETVETLALGWDGRQYVLPRLPYAYDALQPVLGERTLHIHHDKHHAGYVRGLNQTMKQLAAARTADDYRSINALSTNEAFNGSGHVLHTLYWYSMTPGGSAPPAALATAMKRDFGSVAACRTQFAAASKAVQGSGWGVLAVEPMSRRLIILQASKHQDLAIWGVKPLLVCDVWEHAYYLQYANDRGKYVDNFMTIANWQFAARRMQSTGM